MRISEKQLRAAVLAYHGDDFFDCFEEGSEFANEKVEAIRAALEAAQSAAGTATEIDEAARYLRETLQSGKNLKPWAVTDKGTKRKWLKLAQGTIEAALSAQVQDESEIVDCLSAGKPFVFDPATNFCHADDGGAPEHGIKYGPTAQAQDVAGWQDISKLEPKNGMIVMGWGEYRERDGFSPAFMRWYDSVGGWNVNAMPFYPTHWQPLPAAPAKQDG